MKVFDLRCRHDHAFEGWFASDDDFQTQLARGLVRCPLCDDAEVRRLPSAPRLNLSGAQAPVPAQAPAATEASSAQAVMRPGDLQAAWLQAVRELVEKTEDVGERFAEEARRIHYGETSQRGIRGQASPEERHARREEGIETVAIPMPAALKGPLQ
ncbi:MAG: DUF1178 family protein [Betaproteobacteria bacterium]